MGNGCKGKVGTLMASGASCSTSCIAGFQATVPKLDCSAGTLSPASFRCEEVKCRAPIGAIEPRGLDVNQTIDLIINLYIYIYFLWGSCRPFERGCRLKGAADHVLASERLLKCLRQALRTHLEWAVPRVGSSQGAGVVRPGATPLVNIRNASESKRILAFQGFRSHL